VWLRFLEADRVRNLRRVSVELAAGLTVVVGRNGQGKTSLLESIYLLATGRSFRTRRLEEAVAWDGGPIRVAGEVSWRGGVSRLAVGYETGERGLYVEGGDTDLESYLGRLDVVDLTGGRIGILKNGPEERRRFLDRGVVGMRPGFLRTLGSYRRAVHQRNALVRTLAGRGARPGPELEAWDERVVEAGADVHRCRREYAAVLAAGLGEAGRVLFPEGRELRLRYLPSPAAARNEESGEFARIFLQSLVRSRDRDLGLGFTSVGPHRDDVVVELDGVDLRRYGSAGQLRAALVVLKLAKLSLLAGHRGESPLFVMDDYDSDLDEIRAGALADHLHEAGFQTIVATSKDGLAERLAVPHRILRMEGGRARTA